MSFALIGKMLQQRLNAGEPIAKPSFPLHGNPAPLDRVRLGGVVGFEAAAATLITAEANGSFLKPPEGSGLVTGYGKIHDGEYVIHRFYLDQHLLQMVTQPSGILIPGEIKLFQKLAEIEPSTPEEWDLWIKGVDGNQPLLTGPTILWQGTTEFTRFWSPGPGAAEAKEWVETLDVGRAEPVLPYTTTKTMLFSRALGAGLYEWLQLSMCRSGRERWIEAYVGLRLEPGEISAI